MLPQCVYDQFENLYGDDATLDFFNSTSPEIIDCCNDDGDANQNLDSPTMVLFAIAGICTFLLLVICMTYKAISSVSNKQKVRQYVEFGSDYDTNNTWRDGQLSNEMARINRKKN